MALPVSVIPSIFFPYSFFSSFSIMRPHVLRLCIYSRFRCWRLHSSSFRRFYSSVHIYIFFLSSVLFPAERSASVGCLSLTEYLIIFYFFYSLVTVNTPPLYCFGFVAFEPTISLTTISQKTLVALHSLRECPSEDRPFHPSFAVVHKHRLRFPAGLNCHLRPRWLIQGPAFGFSVGEW